MAKYSRIREIFKKSGFKGEWNWAAAKEHKTHRWNRLIAWSRDHYNIATGKGYDKAAHKWRHVLKAYRRKRHHVKLYNRDHKPKPVPSANIVPLDGHQVPGWIARILVQARANGWRGVVISGFRSPAYSEQLCYNMCGAPTCPGRCAGRYTNHACPPTGTGIPYEGAVDVTDYYTLESFCRRTGQPLYGGGYALPYDLPHFSHSGR